MSHRYVCQALSNGGGDFLIFTKLLQDALFWNFEALIMNIYIDTFYANLVQQLPSVVPQEYVVVNTFSDMWC